jgi:hypothetical protein
MKKVKAISFYMLVFLVSIVLSTMVAQADIGSEPGATAPAVQTGNTIEDPMVAVEPNWGTSDFTMFQIPAAAFSVKSSTTTWDYKSDGYIYRTGGGSQFWAPLILPPGANLQGIRLFYYDNSASDISVYLTRYYGDTSPSTQDIVGLWSSGTPGYGSFYMSIGETIDYRDALAGNEQAYVLIVILPDASSNLAFKGVRVLYSLQLSAAPSTATFSDVSTSHPLFQYIEALADSGITTGYDDGTFRPSQYITRGQMAVFLSKALGLHWNGNGH